MGCILFSFVFATQVKHNNHSGGNFQENFPQRNPHHPRLPTLLWTLLLVRSNRSPMSVVIFQAIAFNIQSWYRGIQTRSCFLPSFPDKDRRAYIPRASNQLKPGKRWNMNIIFPVLEYSSWAFIYSMRIENIDVWLLSWSNEASFPSITLSQFLLVSKSNIWKVN